MAAVVDEIGAALVHPPKSSSAATVGACFEPPDVEAVAPQPAPMSLAVRVSGTFIIDGPEGSAAGAGSGVLQALPPPQGSMLAGSALAIDAVVADMLDFGAADTGAGTGGLRLKAAFSSFCGEIAVGAGGEDTLDGATGAGDDSPKRSLDNDEDGGGFGLDGGGDAKLVNPESKPLEEIDVVRD